MIKKRGPIPLAPWQWIANKIQYQGGHSSDIPEYPQDNSKESKSILRLLANKGADPNYLRAIFWYYCDPKNRVDEKTLDKEQLEALKSDLKTLHLISNRLKTIINNETFQQLQEMVSKLATETDSILSDSKITNVTLKQPKQKLKVGRPSDPYMDAIIYLTYIHLESKIPTRSGYQGPYHFTQILLKACFPHTFAKLNRDALESKIRILSDKDDFTKPCLAFQKKFQNLSRQLGKN